MLPKVLWISAAVAFRLTAGVPAGAGSPATTRRSLDRQAVNAVVSTVVWAYLASVAILLGGELNAVPRAPGELSAERRLPRCDCVSCGHGGDATCGGGASPGGSHGR